MAASTQSQKIRRRITTLIVLIFVIAIAAAFVTSLSQLNRLRAERQNLLDQQQEAEQKVASLEDEYAYSQTDNFVRRMARELLGWAEPGETKIVDDSGE